MSIGAEIHAVKQCLRRLKNLAQRYGVDKEQQDRIDAIKAVIKRLEAIKEAERSTKCP